MRILHVIPSIAGLRGGPSQAIVEMVKGLRDRGIDAEIATTNDNGKDLLDVPLQKRTIYQDVPVWFFSRFSPNLNSLREFAFSYELTNWLWHDISNYDLIHIHAIFSYPSTVAMAIARFKKVPYIIRPLGQLCTWSLEQSQKKKQTYLKLIERANLNGAALIHFTSQSELDEAKPLDLNSPCFILPHGLILAESIPDAREILRTKLNLPLNQTIILFLSRIHHKKGLDYLIPALCKVADCGFSFVIAGSGEPDFVAEIEKSLLIHDLTQRSHLVGFVSGKEKDILLQGADLFVLTSKSENFGVAVLEALAAGIPALVTPGVALASLIEEHQVGFVTTELSVDAIAIQLENYFANPELATQMGDRASKLIAKNYTWESVAEQLEHIYLGIINSRS
jgi:glycosyltransferase involved in cell wall biosynthesis